MLNHFEQIICFAAVCKTGSFTEAADLLNCSKSHVSRKVSALERRVNTKLFRRTTRHIYLTEDGETLKPAAVHIFDETRKLDNRTADTLEPLSGKFRITAPVSISTFLVAPLLPALRAAFPAVAFELIPTNDNVKLIEADVDLAIRTGSVVDDSLVAKHVGDMRDGFFTSSRNADYTSLTLQQIAQRPLLLNQDVSEANVLQIVDGETLLAIPTESKLKVREFPIMANMLFGSDYIAWLPDYCEGFERDGQRLVRLLPQLHGNPWPVYLVFPFQTPLPLKLKSIVGFFQSALADKLR